MFPALVVSPHLDDAVLGCGQYLAGRPDTWVATVFAGQPDPPTSTPFDRNCGFGDSREANAARILEDRAALGLLGVARLIHLPYLDGQYRSPDAPYTDELIEAEFRLRTLVDELIDAGGTDVLAPLGLLHPDHVLACDLTRRAVGNHPRRQRINLYLYEELPGRVWDPLAVVGRLNQLGLLNLRHGLGLDAGANIGTPGSGPLERKRRALEEYATQAWAIAPDANPSPCLCPERYWLVRL